MVLLNNHAIYDTRIINLRIIIKWCTEYSDMRIYSIYMKKLYMESTGMFYLKY